MKKLKEACNKHYQQQSLSEEQVAKLMALQKQPEQTSATGSAKYNNGLKAVKYYSLLATAASIFVIILTTWIYSGYNIDIREQVAKEIAYNHSKQMALEITSNNLDDIGAYLSELDFNLVVSQKVRQAKQVFLGGRYCSIQNKLAAQLRVKDENSNNAYTYYQAIIPDGFKLNGATYSTWIKDIYVELWIEGGVLLGLASETPAG